MAAVLPENPDVALLILRLGLGIVFLAHGPQKLMNTKQMASGLGMPTAFVFLVGLMETLGATSVILGVWERIGATLLAIVMLGAIYFKTMKWRKKFTGENGWELDFIILAAALTVVFTGAGQYIFLTSLPHTPAYAAEFLINEDRRVAPSQELGDDVYAAGATIEFQHPVRGDIFAAGQAITVAGEVTGDVTAVGEQISIQNSVSDDVRTAGQRILITGTVRDDLFAAGQEVTIAADSSVGGDAFLAGQTIALEGTINGTVRAAGDTHVGSSAIIKGDLFTYGEVEPVIEEGAQIQGVIRHTETDIRQAESRASKLTNWVRSVVTLFVLALILAFLFPRFTRDVLSAVRASPGKSALTALVWLALVGPAAILLLITIVGIPVAVAVLFVTGTLLVAASAYAALLAGSWIMKRLTQATSAPPAPTSTLTQPPPATWQEALLGAVVYESVQLLGVIGWLITAVLALFVFGAVLRTMWRYLRT